MSLIDSHSCECSISPLELFHIPPTQTAIQKSTVVEYQSLTSLRNNAPVEFYIPASTEDYIDLKNSKFYFAFRIKKKDGRACDETNIVAPINDIFNGLWSNVELFMNNKLVSHSNNTHGYTSMISHLIHDSEESLKSEGSFRLLFKDTAGQLDQITASKNNVKELIPDHDILPESLDFEAVDDELRDVPFDFTAAVDDNPGNRGLYQRYLFTSENQKVEVMGPLRIDMFEQERYIPAGVSLKLRFHRQRDSFALMHSDSEEYIIDLEEAYMLIRKVKPSPGVSLGHAETLMKMPAKYPVTRKECKVLAVSTGVTNFIKDNIFLGQLPKRVVIGMVKNKAFAGHASLNPYDFDHMNMSYMQLYTDGEPVLSRPLQPNIDEGTYLHCYQTLFNGFDRLNGAKSCIIKREDWDKGYSLIAFDLTPDFDDDDHFPIIKHGNLRLEMNFSSALTAPINIIVYAEFDNIIDITEQKNIQMDYS